MDYVEAAETIVQRHTDAVVIHRAGTCLVLVPSETAVSSYTNARLFDRDTVTGWINAARADPVLVHQLRRLAGRVAPHYGAVDDVSRGIPDLVAAGRILAIHAPETEQPLPISGMKIDYKSLLMRMADVGRESIGYLLEEAWCQTYEHMPRAPQDQMEVVTIPFDAITYVFDVGAERVVGAYGWSRPNRFSAAELEQLERRRKKFLGKATPAQLRRIAEGHSANADAMAANAAMSWQDRFFALYGHDYDRGHIIAQSLGGGMDINLFPQKRSFNQSGSPQGSAYRGMESRAMQSPNAFIMSRPIYADPTWVPHQLDYGVATDFELKTLDYRTFENR